MLLAQRLRARPPWVPTKLSTLKAWYDASDLATVTEATGVSQWDDKSGNGYHVAQAVAAAQPIYTSGQYLTFDGAAQYLELFTRFGLVADPNIAIITVTRTLANGNVVEPILRIGNAGGGDLLVSAGTGGWSWRFWDGFQAYGTAALNTDDIIGGVRAAGASYQASTFFKDGTELASTSESGTAATTYPTSTDATFWIGTSNTTTRFANRRISEIVIAETSAIADRQKIEGYLAHKWGLTANLPTSHPYKYRRP